MMQNQMSQEYIKFTDIMEAKERHITKVNIYGSSKQIMVGLLTGGEMKGSDYIERS